MSGNRRSTPVRSLLTVAALVGMVLTIAVMGSTLEGSDFEIDGNLLVNEAGNVDWENAPNLAVAHDLPSGKNDDSLGKGAKEDTEDPAVVTGSIPPNKSDLTRFYVANERSGPDDHDFLYVSWQRTNILGTANMDFEFNQLQTTTSNGVTPVRSEGDMLVTFDFASGANKIVLGLLRWVTTGSAQQCEANNTVPCWGNRIDLNHNGNDFASAAVNTEPVEDPIEPNPDNPSEEGTRTLAELTFGEAAINLTEAGVLTDSTCVAFGSAFLKSRSSDSFTAALKDMIAPIPVRIDNCQPATIVLRKQDPSGAALSGAVLQLWRDEDGDGELDTDVDTQVGADCTTDKDLPNKCSFIITADGTYIAHEKTAPDGYSGRADQTREVTITDEEQTIVLTLVNDPVPGTLNITKQDDSNPPVALAGAEFTLYTDVEPQGGTRGEEDTVTTMKCTTGTDGECSITNIPLGRYWIVETVTPAGYDTAAEQNVTVGLGAAPDTGQTISRTFTNKRQFTVITVVCQVKDGKLYPSSVTLGTETKTSLGAAGLGGLAEADVCGIGGARFEGRNFGVHNGNVTIPQ